MMEEIDRFLFCDGFWMLTRPANSSVYDFDFRRFFDCRTPYFAPERLPGIARIGAIADYPEFFDACLRDGIDLVHTPEQHRRCTSLPEWYALIGADTPRSRWYEKIPDWCELTADFDLPVFFKGARQTSRHQAAASIIRSCEDYERAVAIYRADPVLHWQEFVCRELIPLRPVPGGLEGKIPSSYEFRTFWWKGECVGSGRYWLEAAPYDWTAAEKEAALMVARRAALAVDCTFLVVDLAQTIDGRWIVIECNSGMESGYAGASPFAIWQSIAEREAGITDHQPERPQD